MPTILEPPKPRKPARGLYRKWTWRRQIVMSTTRLFVLAVLVGAFWGAWYLANKGFGRQWRHTVVEELRKRGVDASVRKLTLDPFRGLVAQDLRIYDFRDRQRPLAVISEVSLDINYAAIFHRQPFLNALDIRDAEVTFPNLAGDPSAPKAQLKQFRAHIYFPPDQIYIRQAEGVFCGIRISASGQLIRPSSYKPGAKMSDAELRQRLELMQRVITELNRFNFTGGPPGLQLKFAADLADLATTRVEATLQGERIQRGAYEIRKLTAAGEWVDRRFDLRQLEWTDSSGAFAARASVDTVRKAADFRAQSSVDAKQLLEAFGFGKFVADLTFRAPPNIEVSGSAEFGEPTPRLSVMGRAALDDLTYRTIPLHGLSTDFSWDGQRTMLRDLRVRHASGEVVADLLDAPGDFRLDVESSIDPTAIRPLLDRGLRQFFGEWQWPRPPAIRMSLRGRGRDPRTWTGEGSIATQRARFRGVWLNRATADVRFGDSALTFVDLHVTRDEGVGTAGSFTYDFGKHEVRLTNVKTHLRPSDVIYWIDPDFADELAPYRFRGIPDLTANGVVHIKRGKTTRLEIGVDAPAGMEYELLGKTLPLERVRGRLLFTPDRLQIVNAEAGLFGGGLKFGADISLAKGASAYSASVAAEAVDFPTLTKLYFDFDTARGQLFGSYDFEARGADRRSMEGAGKIRVANGTVFSIPVFGPLSSLASAIIPGFGHSVAREATASFTVGNGVIRTKDFKVSGRSFGLTGHGDLHFVEDRLDFDVKVAPKKGPGVLLTPVYDLLEYKGEGPLSTPTWRPKNF
jgi:hypothetical protein